MSSDESINFSCSEESELEFDAKDPICAMSKGLAKMLYAVDGEMREQMCAEILDYANVMYENYRQLRDNEFFVSDVVEGGKEDGEAVPVAAGVDPAPAVDEEIDAFIVELMQGLPAPVAVDPPEEAGEPACYGPKTFLEYKYGNDVDNDKKVQNRMRRTFWQNIYTDGKDEEDNAKRHHIGDFYKSGDEDYKWEMIKSYHNTDDKAGWRTFASEAGAFRPA
jgi:hypothetical protein